LPVQALCGGCGREAGGEGCGAEFGCAASWGENGADGDVFDEVGVDARALDEGFVGAVEEVRCLGVFEATLSALGEGGTERAGYYNLSRWLLVYYSNDEKKRVLG
jgi:hypothetical protein